MQVNLWVVTVQQQNEGRKHGQAILPEDESGVVISQVKKLSKDSRSFLSGITGIGLETVRMQEKPAGIEPRRGQEKNDQACRHYHDGLLDRERIALESFRATSGVDDL